MSLTLIPINLCLNYEDEEMESDVVPSTWNRRNGRQIKAVVRLDL